MGWWQVNADTLAGSRFVLSPLAETIASLIVLAKGVPGHLGERGWLDTHRASYRERLAGDPVAALLVPSALGRGWIADFLTPTPTADGEEAFEDEVARIRETPAKTALADLTVSLGGPLPALLDRTDLPERTAGLLEWVWTECVLPVWPRRRRILQADVIARMAQLSQAGWAAALNDMRPGMRWLGDGRLQINAYDYPPREISGGQLLFVPVTHARAGPRGTSRIGMRWSTPAQAYSPRRTGPPYPGRWLRCSGRPGQVFSSCWTPRRAPANWWR